MPEVTCVSGVLRKGSPCWYVQTPEGAEVTVVGPLAGLHDGDAVYACGFPATAAFCGSGDALALTWIGKQLDGGAPLSEIVVRDVEVSVTLSSADLSPRFKVERKPAALAADGGKWRGAYANVRVSGELDVQFESLAWPGQRFVLAVKASDPASGKIWSKEFTATEDNKGAVLIAGKLDVGAAVSGPKVVALHTGGGA